jgi:hypothetical protein
MFLHTSDAKHVFHHFFGCRFQIFGQFWVFVTLTCQKALIVWEGCNLERFQRGLGRKTEVGLLNPHPLCTSTECRHGCRGEKSLYEPIVCVADVVVTLLC